MAEKFTTLVERSMKGDKRAFEELIVRKQREILYITSRFCSPQDIEDYAQESLLLMYKNIGKLRDPSCFNDWMYRIIKNTCFYTNRRKNDRNKIAEITSFDPSGEGLLNTLEEDREEFMPVEYLESKEKKSEVLNAIKTLPDVYRECLFLFFFEEMTYKEIGRALEITPKSVSNHLFRAKQMLKKELDLAIKKNKIFSVPAVSAVPVLTQIFREDAAAKIPQELCDQVVKNTVSSLAEAGAVQGTAAAALGSTAVSKAALGIVSALVITGATLGTIHYVNKDTPDAGFKTAGLETIAPQILDEAEQTAKTLIKPIDSLADMIGDDYMKKLAEYEKNGVDREVWAQFIRDIKAEEMTKTESGRGELYMLYVLQKQDKQLRLATWERPGNKLLRVKYEFGEIQQELDIAHFILLFD